MGGGGLAIILKRADRDHRQSLLLSSDRYLHRCGVQAAVREDQDGVTRLELVALKNDGRVALTPLEPKQLAGTARADHIEPHQARVIDGIKPHETTIARENIQHGNCRMAASKEIHTAAG